MEENRLLAHDSGQCTERGELDLTRVDSVEKDSALARLVESRNQIDERAFSRAAGTDQRDHFPFAGDKIDPGENGRVLVGERDVLEP